MDDLLCHLNKQILENSSLAGQISLNEALWRLVFKSEEFKISSFALLVAVIIALDNNRMTSMLSEMAEMVKQQNLMSGAQIYVETWSKNIKVNIKNLQEFSSSLVILTKANIDFIDVAVQILEDFSLQVKNQANLLQIVIMDLLTLVKLSVEQNRGDICHKISSIIPTTDELCGTPLENDTNLSSVRRNSPYPSGEEYIDTYFRLLRTESFAAVQRGIKDLLDGKLDERDMSVYYDVKVVGYSSASQSFNICVSFKTNRTVR